MKYVTAWRWFALRNVRKVVSVLTFSSKVLTTIERSVSTAWELISATRRKDAKTERRRAARRDESGHGAEAIPVPGGPPGRSLHVDSVRAREYGRRGA
jgi:hypothetical protein